MRDVEEGVETGERKGERLEMRGLSTFSCINPNSLHASQDSLCLSPSFPLFLCPSSSLCQTDDRMWREGLRRRDAGRWRENRFLDSMGVLTFGDDFCARLYAWMCVLYELLVHFMTRNMWMLVHYSHVGSQNQGHG